MIENTETKKPAVKDTAGRALIDLKAYRLKAGEYGRVPADQAEALSKRGHFDPKAVKK